MFGVWAAPFFETWWGDFEPHDRALLKRCGAGHVVTGLDEGERGRARALTERGLLTELDGRFTVSGAAWRRFVDGR